MTNTTCVSKNVVCALLSDKLYIKSLLLMEDNSILTDIKLDNSVLTDIKFNNSVLTNVKLNNY